jgi:serine/threonine protein kinase
MKTFVQYLLIITLCTHKSLALTIQDLEQFYQDYDLKKPDLEEKLQNIPKKVFEDLFVSPLMQRITKYEKLLDYESGGIMIKATYKPRWRDSLVASIKIILDDEKYSKYNHFLIQAYLTGNNMTDRYNPDERGYVSFDYSENRAEININTLVPNFNAPNINQFYEMQKVPVEYNETESSAPVTYYVTLIVTDFGVRNLAGELFNSDMGKTKTQNKNKKQNASTLLQYFTDIARGGNNINAQGVLHGDIKPQNMILVPFGNVYDVKFTGFDQSFFVNEETKLNDKMRYSEGFRPPWLEKKLWLVHNPENNTQNFENFICYSLNFVEDSYAIAKTIMAIYESNKMFIDENDVSLKKMRSYLDQNIIFKAMFGPANFPTTNDVFNYFLSVMESREDDLKEALVKRTPKRIKKFKLKPVVFQTDPAFKPRKMSIVDPVSKMNPKSKDSPSPQLQYQSSLDNSTLMASVQPQHPKGGKKRMIV